MQSFVYRGMFFKRGGMRQNKKKGIQILMAITPSVALKITKAARTYKLSK